jgi:hypothetical protein
MVETISSSVCTLNEAHAAFDRGEVDQFTDVELRQIASEESQFTNEDLEDFSKEELIDLVKKLSVIPGAQRMTFSLEELRNSSQEEVGGVAMLNEYKVPKDIQNTFVESMNNEFFNYMWKCSNKKNFLSALRMYGEDRFWEKVRESMSSEDPISALRSFQEEVTLLQREDPERYAKLGKAISLLKHAVGFLTQDTKNKVAEILPKK